MIFCSQLNYRLFSLLFFTVNNPDFKAGVMALANLLQIQRHDDYLVMLKVSFTVFRSPFFSFCYPVAPVHVVPCGTHLLITMTSLGTKRKFVPFQVDKNTQYKSQKLMQG